MRISKVELTELETLRSFAERTFRIAFAKDNDPVRFEHYCGQAFSTAQLQKEMEHPESGFWFGWEGEVLAAYIKLNFDKHRPELNSQKTVQVERLYVEPDWQGRRIGEKLLDFAQEKAQAVGAEWVWLSVWQVNPPALRFYERCGYEIFGAEIFWIADEAQTDWLVRRRV